MVKEQGSDSAFLMLLKTGIKWKSRYEILEQLGEGGFATVYLAQDNELNRKVAIKVLKPVPDELESSEERFQREAKVLAKLRHTNIITVYSFETLEDQSLCLVMEYLEGESLESRILREGCIDQKLSRKITEEVTEGLIYAHSFDVIHRDLSTANIYLVGDRANPTAKIIDFGLSSLIAPSDSAGLSRLTATGLLVGNPSFMSPEQTRGVQLDERSDIYSFGCVLYRMITGDYPFDSSSTVGLLYMQQSESPIAPKIDWEDNKSANEFSNLILKCLQKDPDHRFQSAKDLKRALAEPSTFLQTQQFSTSWAQQVKERPKVSGKVVLTLGVLCALLALFFATITSRLDKQLLTTMQKMPASIAVPYEKFVLDRSAKAPIRIAIYKDLISREAEDSPSIPEYQLSIADAYLKSSDQHKAIDTILGALDTIRNSSNLSRQQKQRLLQRANNQIQVCNSGDLNQAAIVAMSQCLNELLKTAAPAGKSKQIMLPLIKRMTSYSGPLDAETKHEAEQAVAAAFRKNVAPKEDEEFNSVFILAQILEINDCLDLLHSLEQIPDIDPKFVSTARSYEYQQLCTLDRPRALASFEKYLANAGGTRTRLEILEYFISLATREGDLDRAKRALPLLREMSPETVLSRELEVALLSAEGKRQEASKLCEDIERRLPNFNSIDALRQPTFIYDEYYLALRACSVAGNEEAAVRILRAFKDCVSTKEASVEGRYTKYHLGRFAKLFYHLRSPEMMKAVLDLGKCSDENSDGMCQRAVLSSKMYLAMEKRNYKEAEKYLQDARNLPSATDPQSDNAHFASMIYAGLGNTEEANKQLELELNDLGWNILYSSRMQVEFFPKAAELMIVAIDKKENELASEALKRALIRGVGPSKGFAVIVNQLSKKTSNAEFKQLSQRVIKESGYSETSKYPVTPCTPFKFSDER